MVYLTNLSFAYVCIRARACVCVCVFWTLNPINVLLNSIMFL